MSTVMKLPELFGSMVFNEETMKERLSSASYGAWKKCVTEGTSLDIGTANEIAEAMKQWAVEKGATHFTLREDAAVLLNPFRAPEQLLKQHGFLLPGQIKMFQYLLRPPADQNLSHIKHDVSNQCDPSPVLSI